MSSSHGRRGRPRRLLAWYFVVPVAAAAALLFAGGPAVIDGGSAVEGAPPGGVVAQAQNPGGNGEAAIDPVFGAAISQETTEPDEAIWVEGELVAPLPKDPAKRRAAIDQARANAAANAGVPDVTYHPMTSSEVTMPVFSSELQARAPSEHRPSTDNMRELDPGWPDDFELPAEVLAELSKAGTIDDATETRMEGILAQSLIQDFHGIDQKPWIPASPDIGVSRDYVVLVVNGYFAVYDKCGTQLHEASLWTLTEVGPNVGEPKIVYDEWDDRWILSFSAYEVDPDEAWVCLCVSTTSTPMGLGDYWTYNYVWTNNGGYAAGKVDLGCDPDAVYLAVDDCDWWAFQRARITCLEKSQVYAGAGSVRHEFFAMSNPGDGTLAAGIQAAEMHSDPGKYLLVNSKPYGGSILTLWEITGTAAAPVLNGYNIAVGAYDDPPNIVQGNATYVECGDAMLRSAKYYSGRLWAAQAQRVNWGEADDRSGVELYLINTTTRTLSEESGPLGAMGYYYSYPAVDFDLLDRGIVVFSRGGPAENLSIRHTDYTEGGSFGTSALLRAGYAYYAEGNHAGTNGDPFFWGNYFGCDIERDGDNRTLWFYGQFASDDPSPSWDTWVGAASFEAAPVLSVTPVNSGADPFEVTGFVGGPFYPSGVTYTLENAGGSALTWTLTSLAAWSTASATSGQLNPGATTNVTVTVNSVANGYAAGTYADAYTFTNCLSGATSVRVTRLTIAEDGECAGALSGLVPGTTPEFTAPDDVEDRGVFVTALQDFEVCAVGFKADLELPQTITAKVYAASGTTRGTLLATGTVAAVQPGNVIHYIPVSYTLESCEEYDIAIEWGTANSWDYWDDRLYKPFDVNGVIRVRDAESAGGPGNFALPHLVLIGSSVESPETADLDPDQGTGPSSGTSDNAERGVFIKAEETIHINSFGWEANLVPPQTLIARVYEATGTTRGPVVAEGTLEVTSSGLQFHDVPLNYVLEEGKDYDLAITFGTTTSWPWWDENDLDEPYTVGPIRVVTSEMGGDASNFALPHYRVSGGPGAAGVSFDLAKMNGGYPPPMSSTGDNSRHGSYVTSLINQEVYSLGWRADVPDGEVITARVYAATGTTRGALLSEGTIYSGDAGMRWHDIPVSVSLAAATEYDFEIAWEDITRWRWWYDTSGLPYDSYGVIRVRDGEAGGNPTNMAIIEMRMNACNATATAIGDTPVQPPKFALAQPYPNPLSSSATIPFTLDEAGPVRITVYDVLGRRVATLLENDKRPAGPSHVQFNAEKLAAGVYFVKLEANQKSVTRKIAIVR